MSKKETANIILLSDTDNVVVACEQIDAGSAVEIGGEIIKVQGDVGLGHKIARQDIAVDDKILKYGAPIGRAIKTIPQGAHVHTHNIDSDYLHSHTGRQNPENET
jgi:altronate dehydratase small subunit